jgi:hypothetical protein
VTKNDLFVSLHVPYEFLEPVLAAISRGPKIDVDRLAANEVRDLENASYHLIASALERRSTGVEHRGLSLADVAVLSPSTYTLDQIQRLFGYLKAVLEADLRPENLKLTPDVEELARKALLLPPEQRTLFQLVRTLRVGIYKARLIKVVEEAGSAVHAPLPSLDLGQYSPEFRTEEGEAPPPTVAGGQYFAPETGAAASAGGEVDADVEWTSSPEPETQGASALRAAPAAAPMPTFQPAPAGPRCVGCGGISSVHHACGAPLCQHCIGQFPNCPKCGQPVTTDTVRPVEGVSVRSPNARTAPRTGALGGLRNVFGRGKAPPPRNAAPPARAAAPAVRAESTTKPAHPAAASAAKAPASAPAKKTAPATPAAAAPRAAPKTATASAATVPEPPSPPAPAVPRRREKPADDEPRL